MIRRFVSQMRRRPEFAGRCDGLVDGELHGWAWRPGEPDLRVEVEQWVDGVLRACTVADVSRVDLVEAGIGDGAHGWSMALALDPEKTAPQSVSLRIRGGDELENGAFELTYEAAPAEPQAPLPAEWGQCDARDGDVLHGWAWRPVSPELRVVVEQWVDGTLVEETVADGFRPDLEAAGVGDGRYGWSMPIALDQDRPEAQQVELRIRGAGPIANGRFDLRPDEIQTLAPPEVADESQSRIVGRCDGLKGSALHGWAWDPAHPDDPVEVELWIGGARVASALADGFRPDLRSNRVGTGRYGWRLPLDLRRTAVEGVDVEVRVKDGPPLDGGVLTLKNDLSLDDPVNADLRPFVDAVLHPDARTRPPQTAGAKLAIIAYCPSPTEAGKFWARDYDDYTAAMRAFLPALARLGEVVVLEALGDAGGVCRTQRDAGRECVLLSFGPPRRAPIDAPCPVIPVFAWAFPSIPTGAWDGDPRSDWRNVLRFTGRAVALSRFAALAAQTAMGRDFPVAALPPPVQPEPAPPPAPPWRRSLRLEGVILDSRDYAFDPEKTVMPARVWSGAGAPEGGQSVEIEGVLISSFLEIKDKRANWSDLVSAFIAANGDRADATLLMKLSEPAADWMPELYKWLSNQPPFACRVLAVRGPLEGEAYGALTAASHWYATACNAAGLCVAMQDFLGAGRPAISPQHTALADHVDAANALLVASDEEDCRWPMEVEDGGYSWSQHPDDVGPTTRRRISWPSLVAAFKEAYRLAAAAPEDYARLSAAAAERARNEASAEAVAAALSGLIAAPCRPVGPCPSSLLRELAAG